ncbi:hypothetical protein LL037_18955 [Clostridium estertheticum]|nr:hypothetical protein [Clostridium estertheticum]MBU3198545.1 hypothetical protein [Clostridium estertheticum]WAG64525.1 hypothetical protein LL037_18955 [Clostridium estertheticum]
MLSYQYIERKKERDIAAGILKKNLKKIAIVNGHDESIQLRFAHITVLWK